MALMQIRDFAVEVEVDFTPPEDSVIECLGIVSTGTADGEAPDNDVRSCSRDGGPDGRD